MFLDASAAIAVLAAEEDQSVIADKLSRAEKVLFSALSYYETCVGLARARGIDPAHAEHNVGALLKILDAQCVHLDQRIGMAAVAAHVRFGKGRHKASLNMGDCFAYACAKAHKVPLLCKGDDFIHTDIAMV
jgi:ribonuclease VapC